MKEFDLIDRIAHRTGPVPHVLRGIGDDTAVLERNAFDLVTVDTMVENIHFRLDWSSAAQVGWKLMSSNLSDVAAMGGRPGTYFLALSIGTNVDEEWVASLFDGLEAAADAMAGAHVRVSGGDTTRSPGPTVLTLTLLGSSAAAGPVLRSGANPGDILFLVGPVGLAAAGLQVLDMESRGEYVDKEQWRRLIAAHQQPVCQVAAGVAIGDAGIASAMVDISDGLMQDIGHILRASDVGARISLDKVPVDPDIARLSATLMRAPWDWVLSGGDDYALAVTVPPTAADALRQLSDKVGFGAAPIGKITEQRGVVLVGPDGTPTQWDAGPGYEHRLGAVGDE